MSEYQYFEFQALDQPLTSAQQAAMRRISHGVALTPVRASFTYTAGSFKAEPSAVVLQYFDAMMHLTGWGDKRLMFRFPSSLIDLEQVRAYEDPLSRRIIWSPRGDYALLDIHFLRDTGAGWVEAERWLPSLVPLRMSILRGDYRVLYLAWLKSLTPEDAEDATEEPPVPAGLRDLTPELEAFLELFEVDSHLLAVASGASDTLPADAGQVDAGDGGSASPPAGARTQAPVGLSEIDARRAVEALPRYEADAYLLRIARGEPLVDVALLRRLRELAGRPVTYPGPRRTTAHLLAAAEEARIRGRAQEVLTAEKQRIAEIEDLAARQDQAWALIERLSARRGARPYDEAVDLLLKLRDAAAYAGSLPIFEERLAAFCAQVKGKRGLVGRLRAAHLCS
jgi:hypothetical protein